jgi:hypothetical protein
MIVLPVLPKLSTVMLIKKLPMINNGTAKKNLNSFPPEAMLPDLLMLKKLS